MKMKVKFIRHLSIEGRQFR